MADSLDLRGPDGWLDDRVSGDLAVEWPMSHRQCKVGYSVRPYKLEGQYT